MRLEATREGKSFAERINIITNYIQPFKQMWPFYWLKAAAIRDPQETIWQLCYFSLVARWSDSKPTQELCDKGNNSIAISQLIDAEKAEKLLLSLRTSGTVDLLPHVTIATKPEIDITLPTVSYWQERVPFSLPISLATVAEPMAWHYLYLSEHRPRSTGVLLYDEEKIGVDDRINRAVQYDLDERGLNDFAHFTSTQLGYGGQEPGCSINEFYYQFEFPLGLRIERGILERSTNTLPVTIYCRAPLQLENIKASIGDIWLPGTETLPITIEASGGEWSVGEVIIPCSSGKLWLKLEDLKPLSYDIPWPTREDQAAGIMGHIYSMASSNKGREKWEAHLFKEDGANFEIALLNAIARFGIAVLFAGQLQRGGTATPGFDLVALDHPHRRAVLISAKGSENNPSQEDCKKLLDAVEAIQEILPGWYVTGTLACHATNNKLGLAKKRTDLQIWSREDLETIYYADTREAIDFLLWVIPHSQQSAYWLSRLRNRTSSY